MRKTLLLLGLAVLFMFGTSYGQAGVDSVYFTAESGVAVVGDTIYMHPLGGGDAQIAVNAHNGQPISALVYPFVETCGAATLDPAKNDGGVLPLCFSGSWGMGRTVAGGWETHILNVTYWPPQFMLSALLMMAADLPVGDGKMAVMTFTLPSGSPDTCICLDTLFHEPANVLTHVAGSGYTPNFTAKCFPILRRPNNPPDIDCPATASGYTVLPVEWDVDATDPDGDAINPTLTVLPIGCGNFTISPSGPPWHITFDPTSPACTAGCYDVYQIVCDEFGACDTCITELCLIGIVAIADIEDIDCVFPGQAVDVCVMLESYVPFGGFKLYVEYDPTVMTKVGVERGDLISSFDGYYDEYGHVKKYDFQYFEHRQLPCGQQCETYKIKIVGIADMPDGIVNGPLEPGEGCLVKLKFVVAKDANLQDLFLPVKFEFDYDFDLKAPSFSDETGEILYVDEEWPGETSDPNHQILKMVKFLDGGVKVCSDAFCWAGDINLNEYPYEIADAVLFANALLTSAEEAFTIDYDLQLLATDVNQDGFVMSISDFVFLVRIILEDISPKHKLVPSGDLANVTVTTQGDAVKVLSNSNSAIGAGLYVFRHTGEVKNLTMHTDMDVKYSDANGELKVLVYSFEGKSIAAGASELFSFEAQNVELVEVEAADFYGSALKSTITTKVLPTKFALMNNYPNPFNLSTNICFALPADSKVSLKLYNVAGQLVKAFEGNYEAGNHTITWDGTNTKGATVASGIYFYKLVAGDYSCTKKMVLTK
jgi:hypothetical protein